MSGTEMKKYSRLGHNWRQAIDLAVSGRNGRKVNSSVLQALLELRMFCNNGDHTMSGSVSLSGFPTDPEQALSYLQTSGEANCAYCQCEIISLGRPDDSTTGTLTMCHHLICGECIPQFRADLQESSLRDKVHCPTCGHEGNLDTFFMLSPGISQRLHRSHQEFPTKLIELVDELKSQSPDDKRSVPVPLLSYF